MVLVYQPDREMVRFIFRWKHTLLPMVTSDPLFWFLILTHVALLFKQRQMLDAGQQGLPPLDWKAAAVPTSLLTFFVVFYVSNCYARFFQLFGCCVGIGGTITEWAYLIRTHFADASSSTRWNLMRLMLGAMQIHYAFVEGDEDENSVGFKDITEEEWDGIRQRRFLSDSEIDRLKPCTHGSRFFMPVIWSLNEIKGCLLAKLRARRNDQSLSNDDLLAEAGLMTVYTSFETIALTFRRNCAETLEVLNMPVPFAYFHATKLLLLSSLSIVSYSLVEVIEEKDRSVWGMASKRARAQCGRLE